jgi:hypothetical protein
MQELRLVAVSEDGSYAILAVPGRSGRFLLPIDERLRTVAKGQFSRLAQYEIEVENPLRPKEIQDRIRAGETADEIADAAGIPPDRIRRFEGPILAERQYQAEQAQRATIRGLSDAGPGPRLGDIVSERLSAAGASLDDAEWDSRKRPDGNWQVQVQFALAGRPLLAEWIYDPRRRHVIPDDAQAARLCLPKEEWAAVSFPERGRGAATVTPIGSRQVAQARSRPGGLAVAQGGDLAGVGGGPGPVDDRGGSGAASSGIAGPAVASSGGASPAPAGPARAGAGRPDVTTSSARAEEAALAAEALIADDAVPAGGAGLADGQELGRSGGQQQSEQAEGRSGPAKKAQGRSRRASVPSWDEIMFGNSRQPD